jgi:hypothetical protein
MDADRIAKLFNDCLSKQTYYYQGDDGKYHPLVRTFYKINRSLSEKPEDLDGFVKMIKTSLGASFENSVTPDERKSPTYEIDKEKFQSLIWNNVSIE